MTKSNHPIYEAARKDAEKNGLASLRPQDLAALLKQALSARFPLISFSVRAHAFLGGRFIHVGWVDGPAETDIRKFCDAYQFEEVDQSIDMSRSKNYWLSPGGGLSLAFDPGTQHAGGRCSQLVGHGGHADAVPVYSGVNRIIAQRICSRVVPAPSMHDC